MDEPFTKAAIVCVIVKNTVCASISVCCSNSTKRLVSPPTRVNITFVDRDGDVQVVRGRIGDTLLEVAREYDIDLEGVCIYVPYL